MGIEPTFSAWEADVLPLNYTRKYIRNLHGIHAVASEMLSPPATTSMLCRSAGKKSTGPFSVSTSPVELHPHKLLEPISKLKILYISNYFVIPGLTRHPVNNWFYWIPAFAGMTGLLYLSISTEFP